MQGVKGMRFVVVSTLVMTYINGNRSMEGREDVMRACKQDRERRVEGEKKSKKLQKKKKRKKRSRGRLSKPTIK